MCNLNTVKNIRWYFTENSYRLKVVMVFAKDSILDI